MSLYRIIAKGANNSKIMAGHTFLEGITFLTE